MSDTYIDQHETLIYGAFARDQMKAVVLGLVESLDGAVRFAIAQQKRADEAMKEALAAQPTQAAPQDLEQLQRDTLDLLVRFGKFVESQKGAPVPLAEFFDEAPSVVARRRLTKLAGAVRHATAQLDKHAHKLKHSEDWLAEFRSLSPRLDAAEKGARARKLEQSTLAPALSAARDAWLATYGANKSLLLGVLKHAGREELMPLVFDDLAETHRTQGTSDALPSQPAGADKTETPKTP